MVCVFVSKRAVHNFNVALADIQTKSYIFFTLITGIVRTKYVLVAEALAVIRNCNNTLIEFAVCAKPYFTAICVFDSIQNEILKYGFQNVGLGKSTGTFCRKFHYDTVCLRIG